MFVIIPQIILRQTKLRMLTASKQLQCSLTQMISRQAKQYYLLIKSRAVRHPIVYRLLNELIKKIPIVDVLIRRQLQRSRDKAMHRTMTTAMTARANALYQKLASNNLKK